MQSLADAMIGDSPAIAAIRNYLPKVAGSKATVLITGATGTGKEIVARAVHELGPRCRHPFIAINCAAISDSLIESELFGHQRGAFTGAIAANKGLVIQADGGTLFLDEIDAMSQHAQAKLLRVLETREVISVGGGRPVPVDIRIVAATNQALEGLVDSHQFRPDLFYRLNVARIHLPLLRDRKEDIPPLIASILREMNKRDNRSVSLPDSEMLHCLLAHDWPGNVRELRNLIEAVFIDPPLGPIRLDDLPTVFRNLFGSYRRVDHGVPNLEAVSAERLRLISALHRRDIPQQEHAEVGELIAEIEHHRGGRISCDAAFLPEKAQQGGGDQTTSNRNGEKDANLGKTDQQDRHSSNREDRPDNSLDGDAIDANSRVQLHRSKVLLHDNTRLMMPVGETHPVQVRLPAGQAGEGDADGAGAGGGAVGGMGDGVKPRQTVAGHNQTGSPPWTLLELLQHKIPICSNRGNSLVLKGYGARSSTSSKLGAQLGQS